MAGLSGLPFPPGSHTGIFVEKDFKYYPGYLTGHAPEALFDVNFRSIIRPTFRLNI